MDEHTVVDELYAGSRDDFLPIRTERVKQARAAGERELAVRIAALRKPTVGAWLVNQVVRRHPARMAALAELAERMRAAHQHGDGDQLRAAGRDRQALLRDLTGLAREIARGAGLKLGLPVADQVTTTFQTALVDPAAREAVLTGTLAVTIEQDADLIGSLPDIDAPPPMWSARPKPLPPEPKSKPTPVEPEPEPEPAPPPPAPEPPPPSPELIAAREHEDDCVAAREQAESELTAAQERANRTRQEADEARARFNETRQAHDAALAAVADARTALAEAERAARAAHQAVVALRDQ
jgi:hypothetical protein